MKTQIQRFSPHQNAKVFAILMAVSSLVFVLPFMLIAMMTAPDGGNAMPLVMVVLFPVIYLIMGYLMVVVGCWFYNIMFKYVGGIEFEHSET
jgi:uncharacterized membrane protein YhaH (DUF805 family)